MSVALGELGCPSLDYVYRMSWAEFRLRLISFNRMQLREQYNIRRLAWVSYIAPSQDPKKLRGLREDRWWPIGNNVSVGISEEHKKKFLDQYIEYLKNKKHGRA